MRSPSSSGTLEPHLSALLWMAMLVSLAIVIVLPQPHGIRALIASTILRLIFSVGLEPTLLLLGGFNVSVHEPDVELTRTGTIYVQCRDTDCCLATASIQTRFCIQAAANRNVTHSLFYCTSVM